MEDAHEIVFAADEELGGAWVALAAATTAELVVDAARIVAFGADHDETTEFADAWAEFDVGAATGKVGGESDGALFAGFGDDGSLALVVLGV